MGYTTQIDINTQIGRRRLRLVYFTGSSLSGTDEYTISNLPLMSRVIFCNSSCDDAASNPQFFNGTGGGADARSHAPIAAGESHVFEPFDNITIPGDLLTVYRLEGATSASLNCFVVFELFDAV